MKKNKYLLLIIVALLAISCGEDFLTKKDLYRMSDESYYKTPEQIEQALAGAYAAVPQDAGNNNPYIVADLMSDDCFGGGGSNDDGFHSTDAFTLVNSNYYNELFSFSWSGILRVNTIIKRFNQTKYEDPLARQQAIGEAFFLRAYFYFKLSQFFGPVPLKLEPEPANIPRATPEEMYGQIALDLKTAIDSMPSTPAPAIPAERLGHATKWAAEALLGRVFLFYTGYYNKTEIELPDGTTITKQDVIDALTDCINNSGHALHENFGSNWAYSNVEDYPYVVNNNLMWCETPRGARNPAVTTIETIWAIKYSPYAGWNPPDQQLSYSNQHSLYVGLRQQSYLPFGQGWGGGPVNPQLYDLYDDNDTRKKGSILNVNGPDPDEGSIPENFIWGSDNQMHETGLWQKKYMPIYDTTGDGSLGSIFYIELGTPNDMQLWNMQDDILIRYADVLLMAAELGAPGATGYFNQVHERAGLDPIASPTLDDIKLERRLEFAFEGLRYFDLLRWSGGNMSSVETAIEAANGTMVMNVGVEEEYTIDFNPETGGFLPIPQTEITLSGGVLEQTPGWESYIN